MKSNHYMLLTSIVAEAHGNFLFSHNGWQYEIWSGVSNFQ